jgi:Leucine-rich repeat (LRR) protein
LKLSKLKKLVLRDNQLTKLPEEIAQMKNLKELDLRGNFATTPAESQSSTGYDAEKEKAKIKKWLPNTKIRF